MYDTVGTMRQGVMSLLLSVVAICAVTGEVAATELRKCTWANGRHAYVSSACPEGSREAWLRDVIAVGAVLLPTCNECELKSHSAPCCCPPATNAS